MPDDKRKNRAAVSLGRLGGATASEAQRAAARVNGKLGGRPVKMNEYLIVQDGIRVFLWIHHEAVPAGIDGDGRQMFRGHTKRARVWLRRHGLVVTR